MGDTDIKEKDEKGKRDLWGKLEAWAKFLGGVGAVIGAVLIPIVLNKHAEENRRVQVYAQIMSQREAKDTEIRAEMFKTLLTEFLKSPSSSGLEALNQKILFLSLLLENFKEYFSAKPLFENFYSKISDEITKGEEEKRSKKELDAWKGLSQKLIGLAKHGASQQVALLSRNCLITEHIAVKDKCKSSSLIPLFEVKDKKNRKEINDKLGIIEFNDCDKRGIDKKAGWWSDDRMLSEQEEELRKNTNMFTWKGRPPQKKYYAIEIDVTEINYPDVKVNVNLFEYKRDHGKPAIDLQSERPFEFTVSFFDMPYMDNTRIFEGERFAIVLKAICDNKNSLSAGSEKEICDSYQSRHGSAESGSADVLKNIEILKGEIAALDKEIRDKGGNGKLIKERSELDMALNNLEGKTNMKADDDKPFVVFQVITFREEFMSLRDRPLFEEMLKKVQNGKAGG